MTPAMHHNVEHVRLTSRALKGAETEEQTKGFPGAKFRGYTDAQGGRQQVLRDYQEYLVSIRSCERTGPDNNHHLPRNQVRNREAWGEHGKDKVRVPVAGRGLRSPAHGNIHGRARNLQHIGSGPVQKRPRLYHLSERSVFMNGSKEQGLWSTVAIRLERRQHMHVELETLRPF